MMPYGHDSAIAPGRRYWQISGTPQDPAPLTRVRRLSRMTGAGRDLAGAGVEAARGLISGGMTDVSGHDLAESEREVLLFFLTRVRDAVVRVSGGLTGEQQRRPGVPSGTSLLGLINQEGVRQRATMATAPRAALSGGLVHGSAPHFAIAPRPWCRNRIRR
jgi:Protein of unknown function (DUF664)